MTVLTRDLSADQAALVEHAVRHQENAAGLDVASLFVERIDGHGCWHLTCEVCLRPVVEGCP